jgi:hypothetical protein
MVMVAWLWRGLVVSDRRHVGVTGNCGGRGRRRVGTVGQFAGSWRID